jgi:hypothetical protein
MRDDTRGDGPKGARRPRGLEVSSYVPPARLERRVMRSLRQRGLVVKSGLDDRLRQFGRVAAAAGIAAALFAGGLATGRLAGRAALAAAPAGPRFALLLFEDARFIPGDNAERVREYNDWARGVVARGHAISGEELAPADGVSDVGQPVGFFILSASDEREANAIARTCPHVLHGGTVVVHAVRPT